MAGFQGIRWAQTQLKLDLYEGEQYVVGADDKVCAVSRSVHYGCFLAFEGIRFRVREVDGELRFTFLNLHKNLERFRRAIRFNLDPSHEHFVPTAEALQSLFIGYLALPENRPLFEDMARTGQQGYLRPFTVDEHQSIGVTFPMAPSIRVIAAGYDSYLGEPFTGVTIPQLVRAVAINKTGCLKLGINYLVSLRAVAEAQRLVPDAHAALFLDDRYDLPTDLRRVTEWDTSCVLVALTNGSFVRIPDGPLILPSVTIGGVCDLLARRGFPIDERQLTFGELVDLGRAGEVVAVVSVGTAGILNRCAALHLYDGSSVRAVLKPQQSHPAFAALAEVRKEYWGIYAHEVEPPEGHRVLELAG